MVETADDTGLSGLGAHTNNLHAEWYQAGKGRAMGNTCYKPPDDAARLDRHLTMHPPPSRELWIDVGTAPCGDFTPPLVLHVSADVSVATVDSTVRRQPFVPCGSALYLYSPYLCSDAPGGHVGHYTDLMSHAAVLASGPIRVRVVPPIGAATATSAFPWACTPPRWILVRKERRR